MRYAPECSSNSSSAPSLDLAAPSPNMVNAVAGVSMEEKPPPPKDTPIYAYCHKIRPGETIYWTGRNNKTPKCAVFAV